MGISIREFQATMHNLEAERLEDCKGSRYNVTVPCFNVEATEFYHSGSYYIVNRGRKISEEIMVQAMKEVGEEYPGGDNFWYGEVHSIRGMITLVLLLRGNYTKDLADELVNKSYQSLLSYSAISDEVVMKQIISLHTSTKMQELFNLLKEYKKLINPFVNHDIEFKDPIEYLSEVSIDISVSEQNCQISDKDFYVCLDLKSKLAETRFRYNEEGWTYRSVVPVDVEGKNGSIYFHYYMEFSRHDEMIYLDYNTKRDESNPYGDYPGDIDLRMDLRTGFAWKTYDDKQYFATEEQIDLLISHLKLSIEGVKNGILRYILKDTKK